jgi:hypothetical protein
MKVEPIYRHHRRGLMTHEACLNPFERRSYLCRLIGDAVEEYCILGRRDHAAQPPDQAGAAQALDQVRRPWVLGKKPASTR